MHIKQNKIMKKNIFTLTFLLSLISISQAQIRYGGTIGAGIITSRAESVYIGNVSDYATHQVTFTGASPVINAGFTFQNKIGWMFMQPSIQYSRYSVEYEIEAFQESPANRNKVAQEKYQYIDFHAIAGIHANNMRLGFGPVFHILAGFESGITGLSNYEEDQRTLTTGFSGQVGFDFYPISIDLQYEGSFKSFGDHMFFNNAKSNLKGGPDQLSLSITYTFGEE